jgi:Family of unknown function (DUF5694)
MGTGGHESAYRNADSQVRYFDVFPFRLLLVCPALLAATISVAQTAPAQAPVSVMIVGDFHMDNPDRDLHDMKADDVLLPKRQAEIAAIAQSLAKFSPTKVMAEAPPAWPDERYAKYLAGTLPPSRDEVVQLGFRLAQTSGLKRVYGIDVDGEFPYEAVQAFAKTHGQTQLLDRAGAEIEAFTQGQTKLLQTHGIAATLRFLNDPARLKDDNAFYRTMLFVGAGTQQPGADLLTAWYHRNFMICANILQHSEPGDRIVIFYGSGHAFLLRQCVAETPGFRLVEANSYLPK